MAYKFLEHTADVKILAEENSLEKAFESSALAVKEIMTEKTRIKSEKGRIISVKGKDLNDLLYNFLEEFIYLLDAEDFIISEVEDIDISGSEEDDEKGFSLSAKINGDKASSYKFSNKVKAITFNDMSVKSEKIGKGKSAKEKFVIQFVLDV